MIEIIILYSFVLLILGLILYYKNTIKMFFMKPVDKEVIIKAKEKRERKRNGRLHV